MPMKKAIWLRTLAVLLSTVLWAADARAITPYDPLDVAGKSTALSLDLNVHDNRRARDIPVRVYLPQAAAASPLVLLSPGLGGSRSGYAYLATHWALRGYVVVVLQHPGSDEAIWQGKSKTQAIAAFHDAANAKNFFQRIQDVKAVLDQLNAWNQSDGNPLTGKLNMQLIGMAGHSFGAVTTEAVSGESFRGQARFTDLRIKAALLLSPSSPRHGTPTAAFGSVSIPWMLMTGTQDIGLLGLGAQNIDSRLAVYTALPPGQKYELVLADAQHMAFSDRTLSDDQSRNPNDHRAILALSTAFWDTMLRHTAAAQVWLDGPAAQTLLKPGDQWQRK